MEMLKTFDRNYSRLGIVFRCRRQLSNWKPFCEYNKMPCYIEVRLYYSKQTMLTNFIHI